MKRNISCLLSPAVLFGCMIFLHAQDPQWIIYTSENTGLPDCQITHVQVDDHNQIWAGTLGNGVVKFDGTAWKVYHRNNSDLPADTVTALAFDRYGNLWIGTRTYQGYLSKFNGINWKTYHSGNSEIPGGDVSDIVFDHRNNIWFNTVLREDDELSWFSCDDCELVKAEGLSVSDEPVWNFYDYPDLEGYYIHEIAFDNSESLWLTYSNGQLVKFDGAAFNKYSLPGIGTLDLLPLAIDQNDLVWVGSAGGHLARFDGINGESVEPGFPVEGEPRFDYGSILTLAVDENNDLWIGTDRGLIQYDGSSWTYYQHGSVISSIDFSSSGSVWAGCGDGLYHIDGSSRTLYGPDNTGLPEDYVMTLRTDERGNTWIGMYEGGLARFNGATWTAFNASDSYLPDNMVRAITMDNQHNTWIGTRHGLLQIPHVSIMGQPWPVYHTGNSDLPANSIACLHYGNGNLWVGTALGLTRFDGDTWVTFHTDNSDLPHNDIRSIVTDNEGNIWIGTYGGGLCKIPVLQLDSPDWQVFNTDNSGLPGNMVFALEADSSGNIWIGTAYDGLARFDGNDFTVYDTDNSGIPDNHVESLELDGDENIWIGMRYGGVAKFNGSGWTLFASVLPEGAIYAIDVDRYGNTWIGIAGGGVAVYNEEGIASNMNLSLSGHLFLDGGESPLNESVVELYRMGSMDYTQQLILSGTNTYEFKELEYGLYTVKVTPGEISYPETLPTWLGYELTRSSANYVSLSNNITDQDITVIQRPPEGSGSGTVAGILSLSTPGKKKKSTFGMSGTGGTPIGDCHVFLLDPDDRSVKAFDITSAEGKFVFSKLGPDNYEFCADYHGMPMDVSNPLLTPGSTNDTIRITATAGAEVIEIEVEVPSDIESILKSDLEVYPVPVSECLIIGFGNDDPDMHIEAISIADMHGRVFYYQKSQAWKEYRTEIDMRTFPPGIYLLRIRSKNACQYVKVIKN